MINGLLTPDAMGKVSNGISSLYYTNVLNQLFLRIMVDNGTLGGDPCKGWRKVLKIKYKYKGNIIERTYDEYTQLNLP